jgi:hypothetical protein
MSRIELWTKHWATYDANQRGQTYKYPYDIGRVQNLYQVFGSSPLLWFLPITVTTVDPLNFPVLVPETEKQLQNV